MCFCSIDFSITSCPQGKSLWISTVHSGAALKVNIQYYEFNSLSVSGRKFVFVVKFLSLVSVVQVCVTEGCFPLISVKLI